jgi:hypothetical protein
MRHGDALERQDMHLDCVRNPLRKRLYQTSKRKWEDGFDVRKIRTLYSEAT